MHQSLDVRCAARPIAKLFEKANKEDFHAWGALLGDNLVEAFPSQWSSVTRTNIYLLCNVAV
jgi:hypothetical protein